MSFPTCIKSKSFLYTFLRWALEKIYILYFKFPYTNYNILHDSKSIRFDFQTIAIIFSQVFGKRDAEADLGMLQHQSTPSWMLQQYLMKKKSCTLSRASFETGARLATLSISTRPSLQLITFLPTRVRVS